jgi:hypothetical protein
MVNDVVANARDIASRIADNSVDIEIIAESGSTVGFNLISVEIQDSVGHNFRTRNSMTTEIDMVITEPYGMTLIDRMLLAGRSLGIQNFRMAPLILDLSFKFRDADGVINSGPSEPIRKIYKIILVDTESTLTEVGSTYRIKAVSDNTIGFNDFWAVIPTTVRVLIGPNPGPAPQSGAVVLPVDARTVGSFFQQLGTTLTNFYQDQRNNINNNATTPLIIYDFVVDQELATQEILFSQQTNGRRHSWLQSGSAGQEISIGRGIAITDLVDDICASLRDITFFMPEDNNNTGFVRIPVVECRVELVGYDPFLNDYIRKFTYHINVRQTLRAVPTVEHGRRFQTSVERQQTRARETAQQQILRKCYPYFYTGMNTEIIGLDIVFNQLHIISLPLYGGATVPDARVGSSQELASVLSETQARYNEGQRILQDLQERFAQNQEFDQNLIGINQFRGRTEISITTAEQANLINTALGRLNDPRVDQLFTSPDNPAVPGGTLQLGNQAGGSGFRIGRALSTDEARAQGIQAIRDEIRERNSDLQAAIEDREQGQNILANQIRSLRGEVIFFDEQSQQRLATGRVDDNAARVLAQRNTQAARRFIEDRSITAFSDPNLATDFPGLYSYAADPRDIANFLARPPTTASDQSQAEVRGVYSTIMAQLYDRAGQHLVEIEMEIRGDPYWLGKSNVERMGELLALSGQQDDTLVSPNLDRYANYNNRDSSFLLLFRPGDQPSNSTGFMTFDNSVFFNGIYHAIEVTHVFSAGKFTQKIRAVRDLINLDVLRTAPGRATNPNQPTVAPPPSQPRAADGPTAPAPAQPAEPAPSAPTQAAESPPAELGGVFAGQRAAFDRIAAGSDRERAINNAQRIINSFGAAATPEQQTAAREYVIQQWERNQTIRNPQQN